MKDLTKIRIPLWPQKEWFPELRSLTVAPPVALPLKADLSQLHVHRLLQNLHVLQLHAWRLYSNLLDTYVFLVEWLVSCPCVVIPPRAGSTSVGGTAIATGVLITGIRSPILPSLKSLISFCFCVWRSISQFLLSVDTARPSPRFFSSACLGFRTISPLGILFAPAWDLVKVLSFLCDPTFEPLLSRPLQEGSVSDLFGWYQTSEGAPNRFLQGSFPGR